MTPDAIAPTDRTTVKRQPARAIYEREQVNAILDEALVCHVGFAVGGTPYVIPTAHWRVGDRLYLHGAPASRLMRELRAGIDVCVTVTLVDGIVFARSAFHHSMNYRSVVILGRAEVLDDVEAKREALAAFMDHIAVGRGPEVRPPSDAELAGTLVLTVAIAEASAKVRTGPPKDDEGDMAWPVWSGEVPLTQLAGAPITAPDADPSQAVPGYAASYARGMG